jgi:DNA-directed RNA polymerase subunit RPC12/RpoP
MEKKICPHCGIGFLVYMEDGEIRCSRGCGFKLPNNQKSLLKR